MKPMVVARKAEDSGRCEPCRLARPGKPKASGRMKRCAAPSYKSYRHGCRCDGCKVAHRDHMRGWRQGRSEGPVTRDDSSAPTPAQEPPALVLPTAAPDGDLSITYVVRHDWIERTADGCRQVFGVVCPDCRHVTDPGWCHSDRHPIFDASGHLIQATPVPRGQEPKDLRGLLHPNRRPRKKEASR